MKLKKTFILSVFLIFCSFNTFAMSKEYVKDPVRATPYTDQSNDYGYRWTWLNNDICVQFDRDYSPKRLMDMYDCGLLTDWRQDNQIKTRDTYSGKWSQSADGIWSFTFDDYTIPVGVTKIDGVLYAFNGFGELQEGYEYYTGYKTGADGLVTADSAEFHAWLATQYVPECISNE